MLRNDVIGELQPAVKGRIHNLWLRWMLRFCYLGFRVGFEIGNHNLQSASTKSDGSDHRMVAEINDRRYPITLVTPMNVGVSNNPSSKSKRQIARQKSQIACGNAYSCRPSNHLFSPC